MDLLVNFLPKMNPKIEINTPDVIKVILIPTNSAEYPITSDPMAEEDQVS